LTDVVLIDSEGTIPAVDLVVDVVFVIVFVDVVVVVDAVDGRDWTI